MPESSVAGALLHGGPLSRPVVARIGAVGTAGLLVFLAVSDVVDDQVWDATLFACGGGLLLIAGLMWTLPWERLSGHWALIWPTIVLTVLLIAGITEGELARLFLSFAGLTFLYIGVTQPPRTEIFLLPLAIPAWWLAMDLPAAESAVRLTLQLVVWVLIAEVPARLLQRLHEAQAQLSVRARTDALTGLANRHDLAGALHALQPGDTVVLVDLDHFKNFNDMHGHQAGDELLARFGTLLEESTRGSDLAVRYGGEEFLLLLSQVSAEQAQGLVERVAQTWSAESELTFSAGIAVMDGQADSTRTLAEADAALYAAKAAGRNTTRIHAPT